MVSRRGFLVGASLVLAARDLLAAGNVEKGVARVSGDARVNDGALWLAPGASAGDAMRALRAMPGGELLDMADPGEIRAVSLRLFDRSFAITYSLEAVAVLVGLFGLSSSLGAIVLARRREFGMLRHLGMTRGEIGRMLAFEGTAVGAVGVGTGLVVGGIVSLILVYVVNRQSFHWTMDLHVPWLALALLSTALLGAAALTAVVSGRQAMSDHVVRAVKEDW